MLPFLCAIVIDALSRLISKTVDGHYMSRITLGGKINDLLILWSSLGQPGYLKCVLLCFEVVSKLKINLVKSEMVLVREVPYIDYLKKKEVLEIEALVDILGCKLSNMPIKYLSFQLGAKYKSNATWRWFLLERF